MISLQQPDGRELLGLRKGAKEFRGVPLAVEALPPGVVLDQSRHLLSAAPLSYRWTAPFLIVDDRLEQVIGSIGGKGILEEEVEVELGYNVAPTHRNRGVAREAIRLITIMAIADHLRPLAHVEPWNVHSVRALMANGYISEGIITLPAGLELERFRFLPN